MVLRLRGGPWEKREMECFGLVPSLFDEQRALHLRSESPPRANHQRPLRRGSLAPSSTAHPIPQSRAAISFYTCHSQVPALLRALQPSLGAGGALK